MERPAAPWSTGAGRRLLGNPAAVGAMALLALLAAGTWIGPHLIPWPFDRINLFDTNAPPSAAHWFGTDELGRDVFARTAVGGRVTLLVGLVAAVIDLVVGTVYGGVAGLAGGWVDEVMMRAVDVLYAIPLLPVVILLAMVLGRGIGAIIAAIALVNWLGMARLVRGQVLQLKRQEYVLAARALGLPSWRVLFGHLLPNAAAPILAWMAYSVPSAIFAEAFLSYVGLGVQSPQTSWGAMVSNGSNAFRVYPYQFFFPAAALSLAMLAFYVLSDALREAVDPQARR